MAFPPIVYPLHAKERIWYIAAHGAEAYVPSDTDHIPSDGQKVLSGYLDSSEPDTTLGLLHMHPDPSLFGDMSLSQENL